MVSIYFYFFYNLAIMVVIFTIVPVNKLLLGADVWENCSNDYEKVRVRTSFLALSSPFSFFFILYRIIFLAKINK